MIDLKQYDFLDFGCSGGGSIKFASEHLQGKSALGLDIDPNKVEAARKQGYECAVADLSKRLKFRNKSRFVIMSHLLEHLPSPIVAAKIIETACVSSRDFIFIRYPWFDSDGMLAQIGVKQFWSDWSGHTNQMTSLELFLILQNLKKREILNAFRIYGHEPVNATNSDCIIPIDAPIDQHHYNEGIHGAKPNQAINFACYREIVAIARINKDVSLDLPPVFVRRQLLLERL